MTNKILHKNNRFSKQTGFNRQTRYQLKQKIKTLETSLKNTNLRVIKLEKFKERLEIQDDISSKIAEIPGVIFKASNTHHNNINKIMSNYSDCYEDKEALKKDINDYLTNNMSFAEIKMIDDTINLRDPNKEVTKIQSLWRDYYSRNYANI